MSSVAVTQGPRASNLALRPAAMSIQLSTCMCGHTPHEPPPSPHSHRTKEHRPASCRFCPLQPSSALSPLLRHTQTRGTRGPNEAATSGGLRNEPQSIHLPANLPTCLLGPICLPAALICPRAKQRAPARQSRCRGGPSRREARSRASPRASPPWPRRRPTPTAVVGPPPSPMPRRWPPLLPCHPLRPRPRRCWLRRGRGCAGRRVPRRRDGPWLLVLLMCLSWRAPWLEVLPQVVPRRWRTTWRARGLRREVHPHRLNRRC